MDKQQIDFQSSLMNKESNENKKQKTQANDQQR